MDGDGTGVSEVEGGVRGVAEVVMDESKAGEGVPLLLFVDDKVPPIPSPPPKLCVKKARVPVTVTEVEKVAPTTVAMVEGLGDPLELKPPVSVLSRVCHGVREGVDVNVERRGGEGENKTEEEVDFSGEGEWEATSTFVAKGEKLPTSEDGVLQIVAVGSPLSLSETLPLGDTVSPTVGVTARMVALGEKDKDGVAVEWGSESVDTGDKEGGGLCVPRVAMVDDGKLDKEGKLGVGVLLKELGAVSVKYMGEREGVALEFTEKDTEGTAKDGFVDKVALGEELSVEWCRCCSSKKPVLGVGAEEVVGKMTSEGEEDGLPV